MATRRTGAEGMGNSDGRDAGQNRQPVRITLPVAYPDGTWGDWKEYSRLGVYCLVYTVMSALAFRYVLSACLPEEAALITWLVLLSLGLPLGRLRQGLLIMVELILIVLGGQ
jgi:hypothetical protein